MILNAILFDGQRRKDFARMATVLRYSVAVNSPNTPLVFHRIGDADDDIRAIARPNCKAKWIDNARKAKHHNRIVQEACEGELLGFLDVDTCVLRDLSEVETEEFDLAYTVRPAGSQWRLNTGVYFVRVSGQVRGFVQDWYRCVLDMLANDVLHEHWQKTERFGGIHQAALGWMLAHGPAIKLLELQCAEWNCVSSCWPTATNPRVLHVMGAMRAYCLQGSKAPHAGTERLAARWRELETPDLSTAPQTPPVDVAGRITVEELKFCWTP